MLIEIDQSGKIEKTNKDTILAFSNQEQYAILISRKIKQNLLRNTKEKRFEIKLFAIGVYLLLKNKLRNKELIIIDEEYPGYNRFIKSLLLSLIRKDLPEFNKRMIKFGRITKASNAHNIALLTYRKILRPNKIIKEKEILDLLK